MIVESDPVADNSKGEVSANAKTYTVTIENKGLKAFYWDVQQLPADLIAEAKDGKVRVLFKSTGGLVGGVYGVRMQNAAALSTDASLKSLSFDKGTLDPTFDGSKTQYTLTVPAGTESVDATIGVKDAGAYVKVDGIIIDDTKARTIALTDDVTTVEITSYAQDHKAVKHYSVQIVRGDATVPAASDPVLEYTFDTDTIVKDGTIDNTGTAGDKLDGKVVNDGASASDHADNGKALTLTGGDKGSASPYVQIPAGLIDASQKDITISADYQWDGNDTCIYPWALGKDTRIIW